MLVALAVLFCGCGPLPGSDAYEGKKLMEKISPYFRTDAVFTLGDRQISARIEASSPGGSTITLTSPGELAGFTYRISRDMVEVHYLDLSFSLANTGAARASPLIEAATALCALLVPTGEKLPTRGEGCWELTGSFDGGGATLCLEEETALPLKLSLHDATLIITLENFIFLG